MKPIIAWLKIRQRETIDLVLKSLNFWLGVFSDPKYKIYIYSEDFPLSEEYNCYNIVNKNILLNNTQCKKLYNQIHNSRILEPRWRGAAFALSAPYFYNQENKDQLIYNIDADDILYFGPVKKYFNKLEMLFEENPNIFTLSQDLHYSLHQGHFVNFRRHHWSFGVNLSKSDKMKNIIYKALNDESITRAPWGNNIDYMVDVQLERMPTEKCPYAAFITPMLFRHCWCNNDVESKIIKYNSTNNTVENILIGKSEYATKNPRTIFIND